MALLRATHSFFVGRRLVRRGALVDATDPVAAKAGDNFEPAEATFRSVVEQATAAPGEARAVTAKVAKAVKKAAVRKAKD